MTNISYFGTIKKVPEGSPCASEDDNGKDSLAERIDITALMDQLKQEKKSPVSNIISIREGSTSEEEGIDVLEEELYEHHDESHSGEYYVSLIVFALVIITVFIGMLYFIDDRANVWAGKAVPVQSTLSESLPKVKKAAKSIDTISEEINDEHLLDILRK